MDDPRFRRNLIFVAAFHILLLAALVYFARRPASRAAGDIVWMDPGSFSQAAINADEEDEESVESTPEPTPPPTPEPTPEPTPRRPDPQSLLQRRIPSLSMLHRHRS